MNKDKTIKLFEQKTIRSHWDEVEEKWYFSIVDVTAALTESVNPTDYLKKLRKRDTELAIYIGTNCPQVEMLSNGEKEENLSRHRQRYFSYYSIHSIHLNNGWPKLAMSVCRRL